MKKRILITGASGFIGSFVVEEALRRGFDTWAAIRHTSSTRYLKHPDIRLIELDLGDPERLQRQLAAPDAPWDVVVHCAGATQCIDPADFDRHNYDATRHLVEALQACGRTPAQFIYLSSLSVFGPIHETDYAPITDHDQPRPNTAYGRSKRKTELFLQRHESLPYVIFRPTGVYGPRERDYFLMAQSISRHVDFAAGFRRQDLTFVYVKDLVQAIFRAIDRGTTRRCYFVSDGRTYDSRAFSDLIRNELGNPWMVRFTCPLGLLKVLSWVAEKTAALAGKSSTLNRDKYRIMKQRNWRCDIAPLQADLGYQPEYPLERGVEEAIAWYKKEGWL